MQASSNRAKREQTKHDRGVDRHYDRIVNQIEKDAASAMTKAARLDAQLDRDPIKAFNLRYNEHLGFSADAITIDGEYLRGSFELNVNGEGEHGEYRFTPAGQANERYAVEPRSLSLARFATLVAIKVSNFDPAYRIRFNWVKKTEPASSLIYLVDPDNNEYYYPMASTLVGEVVNGADRFGIVAFEKIRRRPKRLELHISGVKLSSERGEKVEMIFVVRDPDLEADAAKAMGAESFSKMVGNKVESEKRRVFAELEDSRKKAKSGCLIFIVLGGVVVVMAAKGLQAAHNAPGAHVVAVSQASEPAPVQTLRVPD